jgi:hypothetical protein
MRENIDREIQNRASRSRSVSLLGRRQIGICEERDLKADPQPHEVCALVTRHVRYVLVKLENIARTQSKLMLGCVLGHVSVRDTSGSQDAEPEVSLSTNAICGATRLEPHTV